MKKAKAEWIQRLWAAGDSVEGPLRIVVIDDASLVFNVTPAMWPLTWPLASRSITKDQAQGLGPGEANVIISDPVEVATVIAIWDEFLSGAHGSLGREPPFPFTDSRHPGDANAPTDAGATTHVYAVVIRDTIPLEDEMGRVPTLWNSP